MGRESLADKSTTARNEMLASLSTIYIYTQFTTSNSFYIPSKLYIYTPMLFAVTTQVVNWLTYQTRENNIKYVLE